MEEKAHNCVSATKYTKLNYVPKAWCSQRIMQSPHCSETLSIYPQIFPLLPSGFTIVHAINTHSK